MVKKVSFVFILLLMCALSSETVLAKTDNSVTDLGEIVVTAGRYKEFKREVTSHMTVVDEQDIAMSPARDLGEFLAEKGIGHINKTPGTLDRKSTRLNSSHYS